jgi:hypothetical protein
MEILAITYRELGDRFPKGNVMKLDGLTTIGWSKNNKFVYYCGQVGDSLWIHIKDWNVEMPPEDKGVDYFTQDKTVLSKQLLAII